jgi:hypothetical protein
MNATQKLNQVGGPTEAQQDAYHKSPSAAEPTVDDCGKYDVNGVPQTVLPHPPQEYIWK